MNYDTSSTCPVHPKTAVTGVCHLCLHERLLILAVHHSQSNARKHHYYYNRSQSLKQHSNNSSNRKTPVKITNKIFALRNSILTRFDSLRRSSHSFSDDNGTSASTPDQDSFISIKFEDNGVASWDKGISVSKVSLDHRNISWNNNHKTTKLDAKTSNNREGRTVIKHPEMPRGGSMRWRKRIGHMFQLIRWKRSSSKGSGGCHSNVRTNSNVGNGWIRTLTKRRTKE